MRELTSHKVNPANDRLLIEVLDEPGAGGACHEYIITLPASSLTVGSSKSFAISFQNGPINEVGVNGLTHEALLAILEDRMTSFQAGPYASKENAEALYHISEAQRWLKQRTKARMERGVEGTHTV